MLKKVSLAAVILVAGVLILAACRPNRFRVERTATIKAPADAIYARIENFRQWSSWSPYEKLDPDMKRTFRGSPSGQGAIYEWDSQGQGGKGRMEIVETSPASRIKIRLDFEKPFQAHNVAEFTLDEHGDSTNVTWAMYGPQPYVAKLMTMFLNMDRLVGKEFETGLANLKTLTEK
jgi:hypothetical protein